MSENVHRDIVKIVYSSEVENAFKKLKSKNEPDRTASGAVSGRVLVPRGSAPPIHFIIPRHSSSPHSGEVFRRGWNKVLFDRIGNQIIKILREPNIGKPLRYTLRNRRRVHIGSFVLIYEFHQGELRFIDFDHHDRIYKKSK